jgi:hypothetical protein
MQNVCLQAAELQSVQVNTTSPLTKRHLVKSMALYTIYRITVVPGTKYNCTEECSVVYKKLHKITSVYFTGFSYVV